MAAPQITDLGNGGIVKDIPAVLLPLNTFSDGRNVRFRNKAVETILGETVYRVLSTVTPDHGIHWRRPDQGYDIFLKDGKAVRVDAAGSESFMLNNLSSVYTNSRWQSTYFNGGFAVVINNGKSAPLYALFGDINAGSSFQPLPNWDYLPGLTVTAKVIRSLNYSLVAANLTLTEGAVVTNAPSTIRVSVQAATGAIPSIWQPGLTTDTADEFEINSTSPILDLCELRGSMYVYSSDTIHVLNIRGGQSQLQPYSSSYGILNTDCVTEFEGQHFVVDRNDVYIHNGSGQIKSIIEERDRTYLFSTINPAAIEKVFVYRNTPFKEIWICYPTGNNTKCTEAAIFNYQTNTWTFRDLPNVDFIFRSFNTNNTVYQYGKERPCFVAGIATTFSGDRGYQMWNGTTLADFTSFVERAKLNSGDASNLMYVNSLYPVFDSTEPLVEIFFDTQGQNTPLPSPDYSHPRSRTTFIPDDARNQGYKIDPHQTGRFFNYKISSTGYWRLALMGLDMKPQGSR